MDHLIHAKKIELLLINKKKLANFAIPADHSVVIAREPKMLWNTKVAAIPVMVVTALKGLERSLVEVKTKGKTAIIKTTAFLWSAWSLWRLLQTWWVLLLCRLQWKTNC